MSDNISYRVNVRDYSTVSAGDVVNKQDKVDPNLPSFNGDSSKNLVSLINTITAYITNLVISGGGGGGPAILTEEIVVAGVGSTFGGVNDSDVFPALTPQEDVLKTLLRRANHPTYVAPSMTFAASGSKTLKVGVGFTPTLTAVLTQNNAGSFHDLVYKRNGTELVTIGTPSNPNSFTAPSDIAVLGSIVYDATVEYNDGAILNDNLGTPDPTGAILAGMLDAANISFVGIYPVYYGISADGNMSGVNPYTGTELLVSGAGTVTIPFSGATGFLWFAIHNSVANKSAWYQNALNAGAIGGGSNLFASPTTVSVEASGLAADWIQDYKLYKTNYATAPVTLQIS